MALIGANPDELDRRAREVSVAAQRLNTISGSVTRHLYSVYWEGGDAAAFKQNWNGQYRRDIQRAIDWLQEAERSLHRNARQQRATSEGSTGRLGRVRVPHGFEGLHPLPYMYQANPEPGFPMLDIFGGWGVDIGLGVLHGMKSVAYGPLAILAGGVSMYTGFHDFFYDADGYSGAFGYVESSMDALTFLSGAVMVGAGVVGVAALVAAAPAVGAVAGVVALGAGAVGTAALIGDTVLSFWDRGGGRELFQSTAAVVDRAWDAGYEFTSGAIDKAWDANFEVGRAAYRGISDGATKVIDTGAEIVDDFGDALGDVADGAQDLLSDAGGAIGGGFRKVGGFLGL